MRTFSVGLENGCEDRSIAWVLGHPGCFAYGPNSDSALAAVPAAIRNYSHWIELHQKKIWLEQEEFEVHLEETWQVYTINESFQLAKEGYEVNAWFLHDWKPLIPDEIQRGLELLSWSRADLLDVLDGQSDEVLQRQYPGERWSIDGILKHVGGAEWWYLDRLGLAFPRSEVARSALDRLSQVRDSLTKILPALTDSDRVVGKDGEFWSVRKLLRRAVWHERDHTEHIRKLLAV